MKCRQSTVYTYSSTMRSLFLEVFCGNSVEEYLVYVRGNRIYVQRFFRTPYPRFGPMVHELYICAECNSLYWNENRKPDRNIDIYVVQCVPFTEDEWKSMSTIEEFIGYLNLNFTNAESRIPTAVRYFFGFVTPLLGQNMDNCCEGKGPAYFLSCDDKTIVAYRRPLRSPQPDMVCLGDIVALSEEGSEVIEHGEECYPIPKKS